ncbi:hypothetical protein BC938DRAFT_480357 [Jimgerdemannia flammicorona]|uniref:Uncharacterized protein n=1 Tax=Jimgerdemannia flammicorona TaxID=994334 RepID=A0A433QIR4_9FUNG|nr:hypothetical protein BC938DRAFT_480357 [Jimgerdemannia flammicorona]
MPVTDELLDSLVHIAFSSNIHYIWSALVTKQAKVLCDLRLLTPRFSRPSPYSPPLTLLKTSTWREDLLRRPRNDIRLKRLQGSRIFGKFIHRHAEKHEIDLSDTKLGEEIDSEKHDMNLNNVSFRESSIFVEDPEMRRSIVRKFDWRVLTWMAGLSSYLRLWVLYRSSLTRLLMCLVLCINACLVFVWVNIGNARIAGFQTDAGLTDAQHSFSLPAYTYTHCNPRSHHVYLALHILAWDWQSLYSYSRWQRRAGDVSQFCSKSEMVRKGRSTGLHDVDLRC